MKKEIANISQFSNYSKVGFHNLEEIFDHNLANGFDKIIFVDDHSNGSFLDSKMSSKNISVNSGFLVNLKDDRLEKLLLSFKENLLENNCSKEDIDKVKKACVFFTSISFIRDRIDNFFEEQNIVSELTKLLNNPTLNKAQIVTIIEDLIEILSTDVSKKMLCYLYPKDFSSYSKFIEEINLNGKKFIRLSVLVGCKFNLVIPKIENSLISLEEKNNDYLTKMLSFLKKYGDLFLGINYLDSENKFKLDEVFTGNYILNSKSLTNIYNKINKNEIKNSLTFDDKDILNFIKDEERKNKIISNTNKVFEDSFIEINKELKTINLDYSKHPINGNFNFLNKNLIEALRKDDTFSFSMFMDLSLGNKELWDFDEVDYDIKEKYENLLIDEEKTKSFNEKKNNFDQYLNSLISEENKDSESYNDWKNIKNDFSLYSLYKIIYTKGKVDLSNKIYRDRLVEEINIIHDNGMISYLDYFVFLEKVVFLMKLLGEPFNYGRGSAVNSLLVYALDLSDCDPIKYKLDFDRFLTLDRTGFLKIFDSFENFEQFLKMSKK